MKPKLKKLLKEAVPHLKKANPDRLNHTLRVLKIAEVLAKKEKADLEVVQFAAILHDVGKYKENKTFNHADVSAEMSKKILEKYNLTNVQKENIIHAVKEHSYHKQEAIESLEAKIIKDVDTIDRLSPARIINYFYYGSLKNRSVKEIIKKIDFVFQFTNIFLTKSGRKLAKEKKNLMDKFITSLKKDWIDAPNLK